ncbi:MAG: long-chain fatty acid--CoA ligase [Acidobacteriota bacterium]
MKYQNIYSLFHERAKQYCGRDIFYVRGQQGWIGISWDNFYQQVHDFAAALLAMGLARGKSVCILMSNFPEWPTSDIGTIAAGGISVGLYPTSSAEQCKYIINHCDAEFVVVDTKLQLDKIMQIRAQLPNIKAVIACDAAIARDYDGVISYQDFLQLGHKHREKLGSSLRACAESADSDETAIMVYTSGTTGLPKGACLSHRYVLNSVESLLQVIPLGDLDVSFSYLPYCHVAERISGFYYRLYAGAPAYFVEDLTKLWDYMLEVKPTIFGSLPRFYEKIHARIMADVEKASATEQQQFQRALDIGRQRQRLRQAGEPIPIHLQTCYEQIALPIENKVKSYFGGRIRITTSGGAPLPLEIAEFFDAFGITILQAYGLTENVCAAFNRPDNYRFATVGPPMPGCKIRIAPDGEILLQSEMMFSGYYKEPVKTAEVFQDGWLLTGDLGEITTDGFLKITGRKKELIVTSTGKKVAPALLENLLREHPLISQAMAYGDSKSYLVALITLNQIEAEEYARNKGIDYHDFADLTSKAEILTLVRKIIDGVNARVSSTEAIKKFVILDHDFSVESDEITPTMKIKRNIVAERYRELLEQLYK